MYMELWLKIIEYHIICKQGIYYNISVYNLLIPDDYFIKQH